MKKNFKRLILITIMITLLGGCQSIKKGLEGNKKSKSAEEFLIKKKNPLVLPPNFLKMPTPIREENIKQAESFEIEYIINKRTNKKKLNTSTKDNISLKSSILKKIKNN